MRRLCRNNEFYGVANRPGAEPDPICAVAWVAPNTRLRCVAPIRGANKSQRCLASASASGRGHFEANTLSDAANLWKMHRRRGQPMVSSGDFGFLDRGIKLEARLRVGDQCDQGKS